MAVGSDLGTRSLWPRMLAASALVFGAIAFIAVLLVGGGQVTQCLALGGCPGVVGYISGPIPIIGTQAGAMVVLWVLGVSWLVAAVLTVRFVWSRDPARLKRVTFGIVGLAAAMSVVVALLRLSEGDRLRIVAEDAVLYGIVAATLAIPLALGWAVLTVRWPTARP